MRHTTINVDENDMKEAKRLHINLSAVFRDYLKLVLYGSSKINMTPELMSEVKDFVKIINETPDCNWRVWLVGRARRIRNLTGIEIGVRQLENFILAELSEVK